ncbi:peroxisomal membrane protein PEX13-like [Uloborus diversus]|uniref:peroxisomal membrane protein PEX13-like n=1 Tax=Uloborus diversus TaxID=327109 RepID=UPI0024095F26|nr:peroxisomal membrane protein PEX13-like [Uloborus diversus]
MSSDRIRSFQAPSNYPSSSMHRSYNAPLSTEYLNQSAVPAGISRSQMEPPPLPPRLDQTMGSPYMRSPMRSYYSPYSPFSSNMYSPYRAYGSYNRFGSAHDPYNSFIQLAEESSRPTFETIESVVQVFSSISMMLESTYQAVYSSYSAILGVVDQFSRLKDHIAQVLSFLTLLRGLRWLCLKILYILRIRKQNPSVEAAWISAEGTNSSLPDLNKGPHHSSWPFFMFIGLVVGAPWLMFKLLARSVKKTVDPKQWISEDGVRYAAQAMYNFKATRPTELSFSVGENLTLSPESFHRNKPQSWLLACNQTNETGLVPCNYLRIKALKTVRSDQAAAARVVPILPANEGNATVDTAAVNIPDDLPKNDSVPVNIPEDIKAAELSETENLDDKK